MSVEMLSLEFDCIRCKKTKNITLKGHGKYEKRCKSCVKDAKNADEKNPRERDITDVNWSDRDWQGGKTPGTVFLVSRSGLVSARLNIVDSDGKKSQKSKSFDPKKFESLDQAIDAGKTWKREEALRRHMVTNQFKLVFVDDEPVNVIFQLSSGYAGLFDIDDIHTLKAEMLHVGKGGHMNSKYYAHYTSKSQSKTLHNHLTGFAFVDHYSNYPLDNRHINMRDSSPAHNNQNRSAVHSSTYQQNSDGSYTADIIYSEPGKFQRANRQSISEILPTAKSCILWITENTDRLDTRIASDEKTRLKKEFDDIMTQHARGFKWRDTIGAENENIASSSISQPDDSPTAKRKAIYQKFQKIYADAKIPEDKLNQAKIEHMKDEDSREYKYCSACDDWKRIDLFFASTQSWDSLARSCKNCKKYSSAEACAP